MDNNVIASKKAYANFVRELFTEASNKFDRLRDEYKMKYPRLPGVRHIDMGFGIYYEMPNFDFDNPLDP